jgi:hypothetical protein
MEMFHRRLVGSAVARLLALQPGERVLDMACGNGVMARRLALLGGRVTAVELVEPLANPAYHAAGYFLMSATQQGPQRTQWARTDEVSRWGILLARDDGRPVGGAVVTVDGAVYPLDQCQRQDMALLWDIWVEPQERGRGRQDAVLATSAKDVSWVRFTGSGTPAVLTSRTRQCFCGIRICRGVAA